MPTLYSIGSVILSLLAIPVDADYIIYASINYTNGQFNDTELCENTFNILNFINDTSPNIHGFLTFPYILDNLQNATLKTINGTVINYVDYTFKEYGICDGYYYTGVNFQNWTQATDSAFGKCGGSFNYSGPYEAFNTLSYSFLGNCNSKEVDFIQSTTTFELTTDGCDLPNYFPLCLYISTGTYPETKSPTLVPTGVPTSRSPTTRSPTNKPITASPVPPTTSYPTRSPTVVHKDLRPVMIAFGGIVASVFGIAILFICVTWTGSKLYIRYRKVPSEDD
jgi:hypothetical protein